MHVIESKQEKTDGGAKLVFSQSWCCVPSVENKIAPSDCRGQMRGLLARCNHPSESTASWALQLLKQRAIFIKWHISTAVRMPSMCVLLKCKKKSFMNTQVCTHAQVDNCKD